MIKSINFSRKLQTLLALAVTVVATGTQAAVITGQLGASGFVTPYTGTNGTGSVASDLTLAKSLVFTSVIVGGQNTGSFTSITTNTTLTVFTPQFVNPVALPTDSMWSAGNYSFTAAKINEGFVISSTMVILADGVIRDGTNGDDTIGGLSLTISLNPANPANSTWNFQSYSAGYNVPTLSIASDGSGNALLSWPTNATGFQLQCSAVELPATDWTNVSGTPAIVGTNFVVTKAMTAPFKFFRLAQ